MTSVKMESKAYYRPQVLLLGNGINRGYNDGSWEDMLDRLSEREEKSNDLFAPMPLRAIYLTNDKLKEKIKDRKQNFFGHVKSEEHIELLRELLSMGFDEILTTNYSYELEAVALNQETVKEKTLKNTLCRNIVANKPSEPKYFLSTCNQVCIEGENRRIWHIHGEARKPDSIILGHYYYANLLKRMMEYNKTQGNKYLYQQNMGHMLTPKSWLDSFIMGDVYILGFGMDLSEIDIWWLLNRKKRENAVHGNVYYYTESFPSDTHYECKDKYIGKCKYRSYAEQTKKEKEGLLELLDVKICRISAKNGDYKDYYKNAIKDISLKINEV